MGRTARRQDAITNSPYVRALIKPLIIKIEPPKPLSPPLKSDLISTQPSTTATTTKLAEDGKSIWSISTKTAKELENEEESDEDEDDDDEEMEDIVEEKKELSLIAQGKQKATVQVNFTAENLPSELNKYWFQRHRLFSRFDEGCQMDLEGWYSVTPELIAVQIAERCRTGVILDAFCGVGGNAIQFAFTCENVIAIDNSPVRLACARHNAEIYGVADRITFILADFVSWSKEYTIRLAAGTVPVEEEIEVVFLSPPWGGIDYKAIDKLNPTINTPPCYPLSALAPLHGIELFALARSISPNVAYYLPRNIDIEEISTLTKLHPIKDNPHVIPTTEEMIEVEEAWVGSKVKAVTCYFGDLSNPSWNLH